jgi:hypothetical protein
MKITIQTDQGPRDISPAYETAVHGLVAHRALDAPEWWALTHLASGRQIGVDLPRLKDVRHCVGLAVDAAGDVDWSKPLEIADEGLTLSPEQETWRRRYQGFACRFPRCRAALSVALARGGTRDDGWVYQPRPRMYELAGGDDV